jgi:hypothetical protein
MPLFVRSLVRFRGGVAASKLSLCPFWDANTASKRLTLIEAWTTSLWKGLQFSVRVHEKDISDGFLVFVAKSTQPNRETKRLSGR